MRGTIKSAHDRFFRESMERLRIARGLLSVFISPLIMKQIDLFTLKIIKDDWVDEKLGEHRADILYFARLIEQNNPIYFLFEHKSGQDHKISYQLFRYMNQIWEEVRKQNTDGQKFPVIIPIILYHGAKRWHFSNSLKDLFAIIEGTEYYVPGFKSELIDLSLINETQIDAFNDIELKAFLFAMKYSRKPEIIQVLPKIINVLSGGNQTDNDYLITVLLYIGSVIPKKKSDEFRAVIRNELKDGGSYMESVLDALREEGWIKGREEGRKEGRKEGREEGRREGKLEGEVEGERKGERKGVKKVAENMLARNMDLQIIHELTGLSVKQIKALQQKNRQK